MILKIPGTRRENGSAGTTDLDTGGRVQGMAKGKRLFIANEQIGIINIPGDEARTPGGSNTGQCSSGRYRGEDRIHLAIQLPVDFWAGGGIMDVGIRAV